MKQLMAASVVAAIVLWTAVPAQAFGHRHHCGSECGAQECGYECGAPACAPTCAPAPAQVTYVPQTVTCYRTELRERQVQCTVNKVVLHTRKVPQTICECVPVWSERSETVTEYTQVAHQVTREVVCCQMVQSCVTDPCTGCTHTVCCPQRVVNHVTCTQYECVPVHKQVKVRVCTMQQRTRTVETEEVYSECVPTTVTQTVHYCVTVPYTKTIQVAVCVPAPSCGSSCESSCNAGCGSSCESSCVSSCESGCGHHRGHRCGHRCR